MIVIILHIARIIFEPIFTRIKLMVMMIMGIVKISNHGTNICFKNFSLLFEISILTMRMKMKDDRRKVVVIVMIVLMSRILTNRLDRNC